MKNKDKGYLMSQDKMNQDKIIVNYEGKPAYNIIFNRDFSGLKEALQPFNPQNRRFMVITDSNVGKLYLNDCIKVLESLAGSVNSFIFEAGESNKNLDTVNLAYQRLINCKFDRNDLVVALGGGVTGDLAGFTAATYMRGIDFIQAPTTLLAMADSSIGGKTGVDYMAYKNMIGAFYQPKLVFMNLSVLNSLPEREFDSGMSEIIKHGLIKDAGFYQWLLENRESIRSLNYETLKYMIKKSCTIKKNVVEADPKENGERALLNFGHTIGHAIEKLLNFSLLHGECVAVGMIAAGYISYKRGYISKTDLDNMINLISFFNLPTGISGLSPDEVYEVTRYDKKMKSDKIKFILLKNIGNAFIDMTVSKEEMTEAIKFILH